MVAFRDSLLYRPIYHSIVNHPKASAAVSVRRLTRREANIEISGPAMSSPAKDCLVCLGRFDDSWAERNVREARPLCIKGRVTWLSIGDKLEREPASSRSNTGRKPGV